MTSEVENVMKAQIEAKTSDLKQIAVSTANLTPDETGLAPLEKQTAFTPTEEATVSAPEVTPENTAVAPEPVTAVPNPEPVNQPVTEAPQNLVNPIVPPVETKVEEVQAPAAGGETLENIDYTKPNDDILTAPPVDVVGATGLDQMNISSFVDKSLEGLNQLGEKEPVVEEPVQKMEMPVMDEEIQAQAPTGQDNRLFEGAQVDMVNSTIPTVGDTPFTVPTMNSQETNVENEQTLVNPMEMVTENVASMPTMDTEQPAVDNQLNPVDSINPDMGNMNPFAEQAVTTPEVSEPVIDNPTHMPIDSNPTSAFDDHLKMPDDIGKGFTLPTFDDNQLNTIPTVENTQPAEIPAVPENVLETNSTIDTNPIPELPSIGGELNNIPTIEEPAGLENNNVLPEAGTDLNEKLDTILKKLDDLSEEIKGINQPNKLPEATINAPVEPQVTPYEANIVEQPTAMPDFQPMGTPEPNSAMMSVDEEPVHGKFI